MADKPSDRNSKDSRDEPVVAQRTPALIPLWVKAFGIALFVVTLLFVILALLLPGGHGPGIHLSPGAIDQAETGVDLR